VTTLRDHIDRLDLRAWASLTKRTAQSVVEAAERTGQSPPAQLAAVAKMSESELIDNYRTNSRQHTRRAPTVRQRLTEANHQRELARQATASAVQDRTDAKAEAKAACAEAEAAAAAADEAREIARTAREEVARKELQRTVESRATQQELEKLRADLAKAQADVTAAYANAAEAAKVADAAKEREVAALDKFAKQGAQLAGDQREVQTALDKSRSEVQELRAELERVRADAATQIAAAVQKATAAEQRAEERIAERAADRQESEAEVNRLRGEVGRVRSDAEAELAAANERASAAKNEAHQRMTERAADRTAAEQKLSELEGHLVRARANASDEIIQAREQAALAIAVAGQNMDATIERARADARRQVVDAHEQVAKAHQLLGDTRQQLSEAVEARRRAEAAADELRADAKIKERALGQSLAIPIASTEIRPAARHIENALTVLHQIDYIVEVSLAEGAEADRPVDPDTVRNLARMAQLQLAGLTQEFASLPARFANHDAQAAAATHYVQAAAGACRAILLRIAATAELLQNQDRETEALAAVIDMLYEPEVQQLVPEWIIDDNSGQ
jgi:SWI/SNF-related matrix-associated actin-dependent regulator 1 of chromatin subfamily A